MYNAMTERVVRILERRAQQKQINNLREEQYAYLFDPTAAQAMAEENERRERRLNTAVELVTVAAVGAEVAHFVKKHNVIGKIKGLRK